jgi:Ran GTPase-activating protein (RanGAP) involved in mRNA processing and transport
VGKEKKSAMAVALGLSEEQVYSELYSSWLKDTREKNSSDAKKVFRDVVERSFNDKQKEVALRKERIGVNTTITLATLLARSGVVKLDLYHNVLRDTGCEAVAHLLREAPAMTYLNLGANDIGSLGVQALSLAVATHKKLQTLNLGTEVSDTYVNRIDHGCAKILLDGCIRSKSLKALDLSRNPIGKGSQDAFPFLQQLILQSSVLQSLKLADVALNTDSALLLAQAVAKNNSIALLDLAGNNLGPAVGEALGKMLADRSTRSTPSALKTLVLSDNPLIGERNGATSIFNGLAGDKGLNQLSMDNCGIDDTAILVLCQSLAINGTMTHLNLQRNAMTEAGATELARSLLRHPALVHLALAHNKIKDEGTCALASMLEVNGSIQTLDLENTWVGDRGAIALGVALATNKSIATLRLSNNHISDEGGNALVALIEKNRSLQHCSLKGNNMYHCTVMHAQRITGRNRQSKQDEVPNKLKKEVIKLHYQMYKLEEAKTELENQRSKKVDIDKTQERFEQQFRQEEAEFRKKQKELIEQQQQQLSQSQHFENQMKSIAENYQRMLAQHEVDMGTARERYEAEVAEREKAEEELRRVHQEIEHAESLREQRMEELRVKIEETKADREKWIAQTKEVRGQIEEAQARLKELEGSKGASAGSKAPAEPKVPKGEPKGKKGTNDIQNLLASS